MVDVTQLLNAFIVLEPQTASLSVHQIACGLSVSL